MAKWMTNDELNFLEILSSTNDPRVSMMREEDSRLLFDQAREVNRLREGLEALADEWCNSNVPVVVCRGEDIRELLEKSV